MTRLRGFSVYVHLPYCVRKCPYCDFNSHAVGGRGIAELEVGYIEAVRSELARGIVPFLQEGSECRSVFFGGGTPSLFLSQSIFGVLESLRKLCALSSEVEITLEANPGTVKEEVGTSRLKGYLEAGINRLSIGAQSFSAEKLKFLGRIHDPEDIGRAVAKARKAGFNNLSLDLMFGIKGETFERWTSDLMSAIALRPQHLSVYGLTIEEKTEFWNKRKAGEHLTAGEELESEMFCATQDILGESGYQQYEVSNYALKGFECRHNVNYWKGGPYLGLGAGAHSYLNGVRWSNERSPELYVRQISRDGCAVAMREELTAAQRQLEFILLRLRHADGFSLAEYREQFGEAALSCLKTRFSSVLDEGNLILDQQSVRLSKRGFVVLDSVVDRLTA